MTEESMMKQDNWVKRFRYSAGIALLLLLGNVLLLAGITMHLVPAIWLEIGFPLWSFFAAMIFASVVWQAQRQSRRLALAWAFLLLAEILVTTGSINVLTAAIGLPIPETVGYACYTSFYPLLLIGFLLLPNGPFQQIGSWKTALDIAIVLLSTTLILWSYWLGPLIAAHKGDNVTAQLLILIAPVGDLLLIWILALLLYHEQRQWNRLTYYLFLLAILAALISDFHFGYQVVISSYRSGAWLNLGWVVASLSMAMAGMAQLVAMQPSLVPASALSEATYHPHIMQVRKWLHESANYLPYGWIITVYLMLARVYNQPDYLKATWLIIGIGLIIGLVMIRQMITLHENSRLLRQVQQQAAELHDEVQERKKAEAQLAHDALHDALTGLPNRVLFMDRLRQASARTARHPGRGFAVLFLDLDQFKVVNDSLGHGSGDQLLITLAQRLRLCLRSGDTVARLGGDEFVFLLEDTRAKQDATALASHILAMLQQPFILKEQPFFVAASIGIVVDVEHYEQPDDILRDADIAMYEAKSQGKARWVLFSPTMREQAQARLALEHDLRYAVERDELELYYQPIVALQSDRITGFEALVRWHHPQRGLVAPSEFIPIAEESGLMLSIGQWVLKTACTQLRAWQLQFPTHPPLTMSVNISGLQFAAPGFVEQVAATLGAINLDPATLRLELTESVWLNSTPAAITLFQQLNQMGIQLHIDDFGTGYSSLAYLQNFPVRMLKIDRSFLNKMSEGHHNQDLVRAVIAMAHNLGMETVAEGVETLAQLNQLKALGCNYGQGYLLSRPINRAGIEQLLGKLQPEQTASTGASADAGEQQLNPQLTHPRPQWAAAVGS